MIKNTTIRERLQKIKNLAERGIEGEAANATAQLVKLLAKYGLTIEDLEDAEERVYKFHCQTKFELRLMIQIYGMIRKVSAVHYQRYYDKKAYGFIFTAQEYADAKEYFDYYRRELKKEMERLCMAFINHHELFGVSSPDDPEPEPMSPEELKAMRKMMESLLSQSMIPKRLRIES